VTTAVALLQLLWVLTAFAPSRDGQGFRAELDGQHVVPPTPSLGSATVEWSFDYDTDHSAVWIAYSDLTGLVTGAYVAKGDSTDNGPIVRTLSSDFFPSSDWFDFDFGYEDYWALNSDSAYVVITTTTYPEGEVRGHLALIPNTPTATSSWGTLRAGFR
jgi:hypothetical protein